jgi:hypothetical protein
MRSRYRIALPDPARAHGPIPALSFTANGADAFAEQLQAALRGPELFERWCALQDDPEGVDPGLGAVDPQAQVKGEQHDLGIELVVETSLPSKLLQLRLHWLAGNHWQLRDVTAA